MRKQISLKLGAATIALGVATAAPAAYAQDQTTDNTTEGAAPAEAIVVTGSRIARPDLTSNSPITVVSGDVLRDQGAINVEAVLNQLPQITPGLNANVNNGGNGTVTIDVRGLGARRRED